MLMRRKPTAFYSRVPSRKARITQTGPEVSEQEAGILDGSAEALWNRIVKLYDTGVQPGMQLVVMRHGHKVINRAIGYARGNAPGEDRSNAAPMLLDTPNNVFSASKAVTAMLVHKLDELGALHIDDAVADYVPGFERHGKGNITIRQVLTHRSGLARLPADAFDLDLLSDPQAIRDLIIDAIPSSEIGGAPAYHALSGGFILGEVMRGASGRDPRDLLDEYIKKPLNLQWMDYGVSQDDVDKVALNACTGVMPKLIGLHMKRVLGLDYADAVDLSNDPRFLTALVPAGNLITTANDIARFYQCLLNGGELDGVSVFEQKTVRRAITPDGAGAGLDRTIGLPLRYSPGFMVGHRGVGLYGLNQHRSFGHLGLSSTITSAQPQTDTVISWITTGKPILGRHLPQMLGVLNGFNKIGRA